MESVGASTTGTSAGNEASGSDDSGAPFDELLDFTSRAETLIAELLMLSDRIPPEFCDPRYDPVLFNLSYFDNADDFEARIEGNREFQALEDDLRESCSDYMQRYFLLVNGIVIYYQEICTYLKSLQETLYGQPSLLRIIEDKNGSQLLVESVTLFGCLLLLLQHRLHGALREKLIIAHLRNARCFDSHHLEYVLSLCRMHEASTHEISPSLSASSMISIKNPEDLFLKFSLPEDVVEVLISRLRHDDLYSQICHYPDPNHRTAALGSQGGSLYVLLLFFPKFLHNGLVMREIVDRFFKDCWVVPIFMYFTVDLSVSWDVYKAAKASLSSCLSSAYVSDLSQHHCSKALSWKINGETIKDCLEKLSTEIHSLSYINKRYSEKKLLHILSVLKEIEQRHQIEENIQMRQLAVELRRHLQDMLITINLDSDVLSTFSVVTNTVYAWGYIEGFTERLWKMIDKDLSTVLNLHSFFLKFQPMLEIPIYRISQNNSRDLLYVSNYYTSLYVTRICAILKIIPVMLFKILNDDLMFMLQPYHPLHHIERDTIDNALKLDQHSQVAKVVNKVSVFSQELLTMTRAFHGTVDLDVHKWLEMEIRIELSKRYEKKFKSFFSSPKSCLEDLELEVQNLHFYIFSQLHIMEHLQDLFHIPGICIWQEELTCIMQRFATEESNNFLKRRTQDCVGAYEELSNVSKTHTFLGKLLHQILQLTNPSRSMYLEPMTGWFDAEGHELLGLHFFHILEPCLGPVGMTSLDSLITFLIMERLQGTLTALNKLLDTKSLEEIQLFDSALGPSTTLPLLGLSPYKRVMKTVDALLWEHCVWHLACIGQLQLLRHLISLKLKSACKAKARLVSFAVEEILSSVFTQKGNLLKDRVHMKDKGHNDETVECCLQDLSRQEMICGFSSAFNTTYISMNGPPLLPRCLSIMTISQLPNYMLDMHLGTLTRRLNRSAQDFSSLVIGLGTFLRQFPPAYMSQYVEYMGQYIRTLAETTFCCQTDTEKVSADPSLEVLKGLSWLMYFCKHMDVPKDVVDLCIPPHLLTCLQT